jgi:hypothetical protein
MTLEIPLRPSPPPPDKTMQLREEEEEEDDSSSSSDFSGSIMILDLTSTSGIQSAA